MKCCASWPGMARAPAKAPEDGRKRPYVPATNVLLCGTKDVGARHKAGHDDVETVHQRDRNPPRGAAAMSSTGQSLVASRTAGGLEVAGLSWLAVRR